MHLLIGLGNIGKEYAKTRHNFGFLALDQIIAYYSLSALGKKFSSEVFVGEIAGKKIIALKPQTYMNNSGIAALEAMQFYRIPLQNTIVLHDEIDIDLGRIKTKIGGGSAGHNGLRSLDTTIGKEYWRIRLGVGRPENKEFEVSDYVLSKFTKDEMVIVEEINKKISTAISLLIDGNATLFANKFAL
ncbi:MAG: aminoacyl-tRNA hydrolase [Rickettsiales bacterium]|nr:aminoacyl-tRNA hydrolase [Rickettsiales bacterium]